jgi:chromosome segregation ATPase
VLYLAEVQKKAGFIGVGRPEFKLLACQRSEYSWTAINGDDVITAPDDASYNAGTLVMLEVNGNRQIQRHYEAGRTLTTILQTFSNLSKKSKTQEEEIEQWKQSLTYQSQELNRRELEIEARQEQLEQAEADLEQLESQHQELQKLRQALEAQQADLDRKASDLEGAWAHLQGEMRRLEERQDGHQSLSLGLDTGQAEQVGAALQRLSESILPIEILRDPLNLVQDGLAGHQRLLGEYRQNLERERQGLEGRQQDLHRQDQDLSQQWAEWYRSEADLVSKKETLKLCQQRVKFLQDQIQVLSQTLQSQTQLHRQLYGLLSPTDQVRLSKKVDVNRLEAMPLEGLEALVSDLERDLGQASRFVSEQEEELASLQQGIEEMQVRISQMPAFDRLQVETELAEEQDRYQMLNETLVGQRRNLMEREEVISQHQAILKRRQGLVVEDQPTVTADLELPLNLLDEERLRTTETIQVLQQNVQQTQSEVGELRQEIAKLERDLGDRRSQIEAFEAQLRQQRVDLAILAGKLGTCEDLISPAQEGASGLRQSLENFAREVAKLQELNDYQIQAVSELRQAVFSASDYAQV